MKKVYYKIVSSGCGDERMFYKTLSEAVFALKLFKNAYLVRVDEEVIPVGFALRTLEQTERIQKMIDTKKKSAI